MSKIPGMNKMTARNIAHDRRRVRLLAQRAKGEEMNRTARRKRRQKG